MMDYVSTTELSTKMKGGGHGGDLSGFVMMPLSWPPTYNMSIEVGGHGDDLSGFVMMALSWPPTCNMSIIVVGRKTKEHAKGLWIDAREGRGLHIVTYEDMRSQT